MLINKQKVISEKKFVGEISEQLKNKLKENKFIAYKVYDVNEQIRKKMIQELKEGKLRLPA
jgi:glucose-6-phosphate-specific signal transduction histidine kinase